MKKLKVLFIHHSTGGLLIRNGNVRKILALNAPNIEFWDHGYNLYRPVLLSRLLGGITFRTGLSNQYGKITGKDFNIVISNNSPKEYAAIFSQSPDEYTLKNILQFEVVAFKNCFPTSKIESDNKLELFISYYRKIASDLVKYKNLFIIFTPPPLRSEVTKSLWAENARKLANWMKTHLTRNNIAVFDFFDLLSGKNGENKNMLKRDYCNIIPIDSHPNKNANKITGGIFADFINQTAEKYYKNSA